MARISPLMALPPVIFAGFAALVYFGMMREDPDGLPSTRIGQEAPPITETALPGYPAVSAEDLRSGELTKVTLTIVGGREGSQHLTLTYGDETYWDKIPLPGYAPCTLHTTVLSSCVAACALQLVSDSCSPCVAMGL